MAIDDAAILAQLDPDQLAVVKAITGPVCVIAGAGTGKTRVITNRIAYAINSGVTDPRPEPFTPQPLNNFCIFGPTHLVASFHLY
jgi:hypothetical protein